QRQPVILALRPAVFDIDIAVLNIACFIQALPECGRVAFELCLGLAAEIPDHRYRRTLRPRRHRPNSRAPDPRNELPPSHSITSSARMRIGMLHLSGCTRDPLQLSMRVEIVCFKHAADICGVPTSPQLSITSSAVASSVRGTVRPSISA